jgi:hypothetical protein
VSRDPIIKREGFWADTLNLLLLADPCRESHNPVTVIQRLPSGTYYFHQKWPAPRPEDRRP